MTSSDERLRILRLVEEKKITAEEAARLLAALGRGERRRGPAEGARPAGAGSRWIRIKVTPLHGPGDAVDVHLPMELVQMGLRLGARFIPDMAGLQTEDLMQALRSGLQGKLIDVTDDGEGRRVEVYLE
ncbi:MAG: SHOCT-like domain-containing protein [Anaerolineales bacterium]